MDQHRPDQPDQPPHDHELELPGSDWQMDLSEGDSGVAGGRPPAAESPGQPPTRYAPGLRPAHSPRGYAWVGWVLTVIGAVTMIVMNNLPASEEGGGQGDVGAILMEIQGKYIVGASEVTGGFGSGGASPNMLYSQSSSTMNVGSVAQRQRFVVLAAELAGPHEAQRQLDRLDQLIADEINEVSRRDNESESDAREQVISAPQQQVQDVLHAMYDVGEDGGWDQARTNIKALTADQRQLLKDRLGWFGKLALAPPGTDGSTGRGSVIASARVVLYIIVTVFGAVALIGVAGFVLLAVLFVLAITGRVRSRFNAGRVHHGLYAETFGIWLIAFIVLQLVGSAAALIDQALVLPATGAAFFASLSVLIWPVLRGARWQDVRADIGLTLGSQPPLEPAIGVLGYAMAIPLLAVGLVLTLALIEVQAFFAPPVTPLAPAGGPAHPIIMELAGPSIWPKIMLLLLAAVAAPIVEETMFRGVLYRHLRDASVRLGRVGSIVFSATVSGFIFASIHPQGWVAIPALMALAYAFCLIREWRGTVLPSMVIHGISNFIVMSTVLTLLSV